jgi:hypothetical protein
MTITIPRPLAVLLKVLALGALIYVIYEEAPPMYRYVMKFERM